MATYPLATLACTINEAGITAPAYGDVLESLKASFRAIYGDDAYLEPDSQDGQLLAVFAKAIHDCNQQAIATYNAFSPQTAVGNGLSSVVKINHMARLAATRSTVNVTLGGVAGTVVTDGIVGDADGNRWLLPTPTVIGVGGTVVVTATAEVEGALVAPPSSVTRILTPTAGWQTVTNYTAASAGLPVETDAQLRERQQITPALNSYSTLSGIAAAIQALPGVSYGTVYENPTGGVDANGLQPHSIAVVVKGGDVNAIAQTIYARKAPGVATGGTTTVPVTDATGSPQDIKFYVPTERPIKVGVTVVAGAGYTSAIGDQIKAAVAAHINGLSIFESVVITRLYAPVLLYGAPASETYTINAVQAALKTAGSLGTSDIGIFFAEKATCDVADIVITVI